MLSVSPSPGRTLTLQNQVRRNVAQSQQSLTRLGAGLRINSGKDDPAGLIAVEQMRTEQTDLEARLRGYSYRSQSLADSAAQLSTVQRGLNDLRGAVVQASGDALGADEKAALQVEADATLDSLDRLAGDYRPDAAAAAVASGGEGNLVDGDATLASAAIDADRQAANLAQAQVAADQRALEYEQRMTEDQHVIATQAISLIEDADFAEETSNLVTSGILTRAANLALVYSQKSHGELIGSLLDRVSGDAA